MSRPVGGSRRARLQGGARRAPAGEASLRRARGGLHLVHGAAARALRDEGIPTTDEGRGRREGALRDGRLSGWRGRRQGRGKGLWSRAAIGQACARGGRRGNGAERLRGARRCGDAEACRRGVVVQEFAAGHSLLSVFSSPPVACGCGWGRGRGRPGGLECTCRSGARIRGRTCSRRDTWHGGNGTLSARSQDPYAAWLPCVHFVMRDTLDPPLP